MSLANDTVLGCEICAGMREKCPTHMVPKADRVGDASSGPGFVSVPAVIVPGTILAGQGRSFSGEEVGYSARLNCGIRSMTLSDELNRRPWWQQPSVSMVLSLGLSLAIYPFADETRWLRQLAQLIDVAVVLMVVRLLRAQPALWSSGWVIAVPTIAFQLLHLVYAHEQLELAMLGAQVLFHSYAVIALLSYVLRDEVITLDEMFAIAGIYVLLALFWASAYALVVHVDPAAILINASNNPKGTVSYPDLVYFSMTTLTSTGYGEITPVSPAARALAMLQQWIGVMFVAILIARLTGLYGRPPTRARPDAEK